VDLERISLASAIEQAAEGIVITDAAGKIQYVNPAFTSMTGYSAEEALGQNPRILRSGTQAAGYYQDLWKTILEGRAWRGELINRRKDGSLYIEEMTITPVRDSRGATASFIAIKQDVTERRAAEEAQRFLASIVESTEDAVVARTPDGIIMTWNRAAEQLFGYRAEEVIGKPAALLLAPENIERARRISEGLQRGESYHQHESVAVRKGGERVNVSLSISPIRNAAGEVTAAAAIVRDITDRKRAEQALRDSEERFRTAFEHAPFGMCLSTPEGRLLRVNATLCQMLGYSEAELIARGWMEITHPDDRALSREAVERLVRDQPPYVEFEKRYIRGDGHAMWARVKISAVKEGGGASWYFITHIEDITERRRAGEALRRSEEKYRRLVANLPDVTWTSNLHAQTIYVSPNVESVVGYTAEEICERGEELRFGRIHPSDMARVTEALQALFAENRPFDVEYRVRRKDAQWIWVHDRAMRTFEQEGVLYADGVFSDVTARRRAEEALAESEKRYRLLFERNLAGVFRVAADGRIVDCNEALLRMLGYDSAPEFLTLTTSDVFYDAEEGRAAFERLFRERSLTNFDVRLKRRDGTLLWALENVSLVEDENGRPAFMEGTLFDITSRKRGDQALRESEEKYRTLVTNIPDVVWTADAEGSRVFVSTNCEAVYGYTPEEMCRRDGWWGRIHTEDRPRVLEAYAAFQGQGQPYNIEYRIWKKDGRTVWAHDRAINTYENHGVRYTTGCASDISQQKVYSELVERLQRRTELILNSAGEGILGLDSDGKFTFVNPAAARMLGSTPAELIGQEMHVLLRHARADGKECPPSQCSILGSLRDGTEHRGRDDLFWSRSGDSFPVEYISTPKIENGRLVGAVVVFRDITEAKRAQESIETSLREKEALLREIHHRVKNNLQIVSSLLKLNLRSLQDPEAKHIFEDTQHRVKAMALVHETLYRSGDLAGIDFSAYVPRLVGQLLHAYGLSSREVRASLDVRSVVLPIDVAIPCALLLTELISNAAKHAFASQRSGELSIVFRPLEEPNWLLEVRNSGGGGPAPGSAPRRGSFGLELVRLLTEQLEGSVQFDSTSGFCVSMIFPLAAAMGTPTNRGSIQ